MTQEELARLAQVPVRDVINVELGRLGRVRVDRARQLFAGVDARLRVTVWWGGANADRILDEAHAALVEATAAVFRRRGWHCLPEFTFAEYGERGSIDLFAAHAQTQAVAVCEIKSAFGSLEETNRMLDVKVRLAPKLAIEAFGFRPQHVGRLLVLPGSAATRGVVRRHHTTMNLLYPERSREIRRWLRRPDRPIGGIWFVSNRPNREPG